MEAEDIQKIAARMGQSEKDVTLALREAKNDMAEAERLLASTIIIVKACYSAKTNRMNGGILVLSDVATKKIIRIRAIATYDADYANLPLAAPWPDLEKKIFDAEIKENFVPAISHDLVGEIEYNIQENADEFFPLLSGGSTDEIATRLRRIICTCLGDSDVECSAILDKISTLTLKILDHEIKEDAAAAAAPAAEGASAPAEGGLPAATPSIISEDRSLVLKTDVVLSPVVGTAASTLNPGDFILVKITDNRPQANYICNLLHAVENGRPVPVRVPIRRIERSESQRLIITTEFGPGVLGRTVVQENLKLKVTQEAGGASSVSVPKGPIVLIVLAALVVLGLLMVAVYFITTLI